MGMSTYGFNDDYIASSACISGPGATTGGRDRVFKITPTASGTLTVSAGYQTDGVTDECATSMTVPTCWAKVLYARTTCKDTTSEIACVVGAGGAGISPAKIQFSATANTPYYVFVDGFDDQPYSYGPFNLIVTLK
jgi:hypothetical protein